MSDLCLEVDVPKDINLIAQEEPASFIEIDRDQEDKDVVRYQRTKDKLLFEKIYKNRIPTLQIWARQYYYLMDSKEDMFCEFSKFFAKAVKEYNRKKGSFNTCLFTFLINRVRNLNVGKNAKKRKPQFTDSNVKSSNFLYSLEYTYKDAKSDGSNTLKDIIADPKSHNNSVINRMGFEETIDNLSYGCPTVRGFLKKICDGGTLSSVIKEYKTVTGDLKIEDSFANKLNKRRNKSLVKKIIESNNNIKKFSVINYSIDKNKVLHYTIELKKTKESGLILKAIRKFKKNKPMFMSKIEN